MKAHKLKTWPQFFNQVKRGLKTFEIRENDRDFKVNDLLNLYEWDPETKDYTGDLCIVVVTSILEGGKFGIEKNFCVMSVRLI